ncbi:MAG: two-component system response regulator [Chloroflexi bacterium]|nr:two-component system response regulator [Chloroflexota bacterium]
MHAGRPATALVSRALHVPKRARTLRVLVVEDNERLLRAMCSGLDAVADISLDVVGAYRSGEEALAHCLSQPPDVILMDVRLAGPANGIATAVSIRRELPRQPVVFYSIQDNDEYFRAFIDSGILSHYAYVLKSNYLLPDMIAPLLTDAVDGRGFIDPDVESRVQEVREKDRGSPMALLEPNEQAVARMLAEGLNNEQIAGRMGFRDKRTIARTNGQIYAAWGLSDNPTEEKIARTRAAIIVRAGRLITWDAEGRAHSFDSDGREVPFEAGLSL